MIHSLETLLSSLPAADVATDVPLRDLTSFRIGGPASAVYRPASAAELSHAIEAAGRLGVPLHLMGNGTNVLAPDAGFPGMILRLDRPMEPLRIEGRTMTVSAGQSLHEACLRAAEAGLMGLESLSGIPGTVGGAVAMNAGAYGSEISDYLRSVTVLRNGAAETVPVRKSDFGPRRSPFGGPSCIVLRAEFLLPVDDGTASARMEDCARRRREKQPLAFPSAGSVFKRPAGGFAGTLIEQCGLKGTRIGGAEVSRLHAGFIINTGGASERDVLELIALIQKAVFRSSGILLEREIRRLCEI